MALLLQGNVTWTAAGSSMDQVIISNGGACIIDGIYFQLINAQATNNPSTFNLTLNELYYPTNQTFPKWAINLPLAVSTAIYYNIGTGYYPFGTNGLVFGNQSQVTLHGDNGSSTGFYHFQYYLYGDIL